MIWKSKHADGGSADYAKNWQDIGLHPEVIALQNSLREEYRRKWPPPNTITDLGEERFNESLDCWFALRRQADELAEKIFEKIDRQGYEYKAFATDDLLLRAIRNNYDPWSCCFDLVFRQNYRFPPSFSHTSEFFNLRLNDTQKKFIYLDNWWSRVMNSGADPMFSDPEPAFITAWWSLDVIGWPSFEERVQRSIEQLMRTTASEIRANIQKHGPLEAGYQLRLRRFNDRSGSLNEEDMTSLEQRSLRSLQKYMFDRQKTFERKVLQAVWKRRSDLIQPPAVDYPSPFAD